MGSRKNSDRLWISPEMKRAYFRPRLEFKLLVVTAQVNHNITNFLNRADLIPRSHQALASLGDERLYTPYTPGILSAGCGGHIRMSIYFPCSHIFTHNASWPNPMWFPPISSLLPETILILVDHFVSSSSRVVLFIGDCPAKMDHSATLRATCGEQPVWVSQVEA